MKYIKAKFVLAGGPVVEDYDVYGFDSVWTKKTSKLDDLLVESGSIVDFQAIRVRRDGKVLLLASTRNVRKIRAMVEKGQMTLAPGQKLEDAPIVVAAPKPEEESWPDAPDAEPVDQFADPEDDDDGAPEPIVPVVETKVRRKRSAQDLTPDVEA